MAKKVAKSRVVLLDAHAILHRAYHALPHFTSHQGEPTGGLFGLASMLIKIIADLKPSHLIAAYDLPTPTYRHDAYHAYKAGRPKAPDALVLQMQRSRDLIAALNIPIFDKEGFEADDILGTVVEKLKRERRVEIIIASGDMDTLQLVRDPQVKVYTLRKGISDVVLYDEKAVTDRFGFPPGLLPDFKGLAGDPSDNIPGVKGIGEKTAALLIKKFGSLEHIYQTLKEKPHAFKNAGFRPRVLELLKAAEEEARFSKLLGTIRRDAPIRFTLPDTPWRETVDVTRAVGLFQELDFRALPDRLRAVLEGDMGARDEGARPTTPPPTPELKETTVALWLINSATTNPTLSDILAFAKKHSFVEARRVVFETLKEFRQTPVFEKIEQPLIPIVEKMERRGVLLDSGYLKKLGVEYHAVLSAREQKIWKLTGETFNINSPKQLAEVLFVKLALVGKRQKRTPTGAFTTKESELLKLKDVHPVISLILEYRELSKLLTTYIDTLPAMVGPDGRLHTHFLQAGTTTGRMASEDPNLQNIPNATELGRNIRRAFIAPKGWELLSFDYSQIELRIAAILSGDSALMDIFIHGDDVHTAVAAQVFGVSPDTVTKEMRRRAKVINFGVMYGMGVNALREALGTTREEAQRFYDEYFATYRGLAAYLDRVKAEAYRLGYTETFFGRHRYFPALHSPLPYIRAAAERMAINAPIQGTGADVIKLAMVRVDEYLRRAGRTDTVFLLLQVHDELVYEVEARLSKEVLGEIKRVMESVLSSTETRGVPIVVDAAMGRNWGEMKKHEG